MRKLYTWKAVMGEDLITPPSVGHHWDLTELDDYYESEEEALAMAEKYEKAGGFVDLMLLTVYELTGV